MKLKMRVGRLEMAIGKNRFGFGAQILRGRSAYGRYLEIWLPRFNIGISWADK